MIRPSILLNADNAFNMPRLFVFIHILQLLFIIRHSLQLIGRTRSTKEDENDDGEPDLVRLLRFIRNLVDGRGKIELMKLFKYFTSLFLAFVLLYFFSVDMQNEKG